MSRHITQRADMLRLSCRTSLNSLARCQSAQCRGFATTTSDQPLIPDNTKSQPSSPSPNFKDQLDTGPSFSDFVSSKDDSTDQPRGISLSQTPISSTVSVGKSTHTRLPEWLKTPIPVGDNFKRIKNDLRGLNLHTGKL